MTSDVQELLQRPAGELAAMVRDGEVAALELTEAALARAEALEPQIAAFTDLDPDGAVAAAAQVQRGDERPLAGVPIAVKNNRAVLGLPVRSGARITDALVAAFDHHTTARLRAAGAVIIGTTALPEWGLLPTTEPLHREPTRNPWDLGRTAGGSSGGSAAAVAAGIVPLAHGNDGGGSLRIPAACTGLVGLKPQRGRVSQGPETGENYLVVDGALTRTIADTALALDVLAGPELGDATWAPPPAEPYLDAMQRDPGRLRIGVLRDAGIDDLEVSPEQLAAVETTIELLDHLGHEIVPTDVQMPLPASALSALFVDLFTDMGSVQQRVLGGAGKAAGGGVGPVEEADLDPLGWAVVQRAAGRTATDAWQTKFMADGVARMIIATFAGYDLILTPALSALPPSIGTITAGLDDPMEAFTRAERFMAFSPVANLTGLPAISLPVSESAGLPVGVQLTARACEEATLLQVGRQLEAVLDWGARRSPLAAAAHR